MKKLEEIQKIVNYSKLGWSDCKIAEEFNMSRNTVRKYRKRYWKAQEELISANPETDYKKIEDILIGKPTYNKTKRKPYKYTPEVDRVLNHLLWEEDRELAKGEIKKPYAKTEIHRRILDYGFEIGYTTISKKIDEKRLARSNIGPWYNPEPDFE